MSISLRNDQFFPLLALYGKLRRVFRPRPLPSSPDICLHLGCGRINHPRFVNIDGVDWPHVHYVQSLTKLTRFGNETVSFIYVSHALEHFPRTQTISILREWYRTLKKGGRLCLSVPDFDFILDMYEFSKRDADAIQGPLFGEQDYPFNFHYRVFNRASLTRALLEAGFSTVSPWQHGSDDLHTLPDWSGQMVGVNGHAMPVSLNLEATK